MKRLLITLSMALMCALHLLGLEPENEKYALINVSVCSMHRTPDFDAEMITQGQMGMPVRVLAHEDWYRIQTPDDYEGWVHRKSIRCVTLDELRAWNRAEKVVVTALYGRIYEKPAQKSAPVSDVVAGDRVKYVGKQGKFYAVELPDGRRGYLPKADGELLGEWRANLKNDAASILVTARELLGFPYLWGGISTKGMDCSGFVRTVLYQHDMIIPRDASQQAAKGQRLEISPDFGNLQPGDLVFFGRKAEAGQRERVSHVGFYCGGKEFIHCLGLVEQSSFDPASPVYDAYNTGRLLFAARVLPYINKEEGLNTTDKNFYYQADFE